MDKLVKLAAVVIPLVLVGACTNLGDKDRASIDAATRNAAEAKDTANRALSLAQQALDAARSAQSSAGSAAQAAQQAAADAKSASDKADRMFQKSLHK